MIKNKKIFISGFAGSIGSELFRQLVEAKNEIYGIDLDETRMFDLIEEYRLRGYKVYGQTGSIEKMKDLENALQIQPDIIFHCAARKHVSPMEETPLEAVFTNIIGTYNMIQLAKKYKSRLINISTDKVNSDSIMGLTKKIAEKMVKNAGHVSVRFGNVMGSRGSVLEIWQKQLDRGEPLTVTDENMTRYMMTIPEAVKLVIEAAEIAPPASIMAMRMGEKVNLLKLAQEILNKSKKEIGIKIIGVRPGENLTETLMTPEEESKAVQVGEFYIIK